jgi:3-hydroxyisobutyrate dehydrogenase-like beta-hydroxyacid dehydrogenase
MTRTPKEAAEGRLNLLVGGDAALLASAAAAAVLCREHHATSARSAPGHGMKLLHNYVSLGMVALIWPRPRPAPRAAACAPEVFVDVLAKGGGGGTALERLKPYLLAGTAVGPALLDRQRV